MNATPSFQSLRSSGFFGIGALCTLIFLSLSLAVGDDASAPETDRNILRNSRLVAGLPDGWTITGFHTDVFSEGDDITYKTDYDTTGPSGYPAFMVNVTNTRGVPSSRGWQDSVYFYSEPFRVERDGLYTASVYVRGSGDGVVDVVGDHSGLGARPFSIKPEEGWKRISCQFLAVRKEKLYGLRFKLKGTCWFDGFQVNYGSSATPYASGYPAEVALSPAGGELESVRMQFEDVPSTVRWTVTGGESGNILKGRVIDLEGNSVALPSVTLAGKKIESGVWDYLPPGLDRLGQFRIETRVEDKPGSAKSADSELVMTRIRRPGSWGKDAPASPFGVHVEPVSNQLLMAKAFGMNWVRLHDAGIQLVGWSHLEPERDKWQFFDDEIERYRQYHMEILGELGTAPQWRSYATKTTYPPLHPDQSVTATYFAPLNLSEYGDYVHRTVERYKDKIQVYDIWNEPWLPSFFSVDFVKGEPPDRKRASQAQGNLKDYWYINSKDAPEDYAALQKTAYDGVKKIGSELKVVGINSHGEKGTEGRYDGSIWSKRLLDAGGIETSDIVGFHAYVSGPMGFRGDAVDNAIQEALGPLGGVSKIKESGRQVWLTEGSPVARKTASGFYNYTLPYHDSEDYLGNSDRIVRYIARFLSEGVDKVFLYSMGQGLYFDVAPRARVLNTQDERPHPTGVAASNLAWNLEGTKFREAVVMSDHRATAYVFDGKDYTVALLMPYPGVAFEVPRPKDTEISVEDIFGNPIKEKTSKYTMFLRGSRESIDGLIRKGGL